MIVKSVSGRLVGGRKLVSTARFGRGDSRDLSKSQPNSLYISCEIILLRNFRYNNISTNGVDCAQVVLLVEMPSLRSYVFKNFHCKMHYALAYIDDLPYILLSAPLLLCFCNQIFHRTKLPPIFIGH
jgi:hypothetical protein